MVISSFISNSTDVLATGVVPNRLVPTIADAATGKVAFRAVTQADAPKAQLGPLSAIARLSWIGAGVGTYGNLDTGLIVFDIDANGRAIAANPLAFRVKLNRIEE